MSGRPDSSAAPMAPSMSLNQLISDIRGTTGSDLWSVPQAARFEFFKRESLFEFVQPGRSNLVLVIQGGALNLLHAAKHGSEDLDFERYGAQRQSFIDFAEAVKHAAH